MTKSQHSREHDLFDSIRRSCAEVCRRARLVHVEDGPKLRAYALSLPLEKIVAPKLDEHHHYVGDPSNTAAFFLALDAINFGSGYFPHLHKLPGLSGYFTVATRLTEHFRRQGPLTAEQLGQMSAERCRAMFDQPLDSGPVDELMNLFARALRDLGELLDSDFGGSASRLIESAGQSAGNLVRILERMPFFHDVQHYHDGAGTSFDVPFYKRAQLTAADLNLALPGHELGRFDDLDQLTIFADNLVPHVLRVDGVLKYHPELARGIDAGELVPAGSAQEIEIRAAAIHASERIVQALRAAGRPVTAMQIDYLLWNRGQEPAYKARPRHRARGTAY